MAPRRLSQLQRNILTWLFAQHQRTRGGVIMGHYEWVQALGLNTSNLSHSLRTLETRGVIRMGRTPGGKADGVDLTSEGLKWASNLA